MSKLGSELIRGLRWVVLAVSFLIVGIVLWVLLAWSLGWFFDHFYKLAHFSSNNYISFGSTILIFTIIIQIVTVILTIWALISWGKAQGIYKKKEIDDSNK